jgi:hypothetical protein
MDSEFPEYQNNYFDKYMQARKSAGFEDKDITKDNFMKFLVEDAVLEGVYDEETSNSTQDEVEKKEE